MDKFGIKNKKDIIKAPCPMERCNASLISDDNDTWESSRYIAVAMSQEQINVTLFEHLQEAHPR